MVLWFYVFMKTTLDLPDDLYALVKARAALEGRTLRSVVEELLKGWVGSPPAGPTATKDAPPALLAEPRVGYGKLGVALGDKPVAPWEVLSRQWAAQNDPDAPISSITGTIKDAGPDLDMAKARETYARHLAKEWRNRYP
jgi:hypothetical protein